MLRRVLFRTLLPLSMGGAALTASGCGDPFAGPATLVNFVDTLTLYALSGTAISLPSGYSMLDLEAVRTDTTSGFDFAFDIDADGQAMIYPAGALGLSRQPGIQASSRSFDDLKDAPNSGYSADSAIAVTEDDVFVARSRTSYLGCVYYGSVSRFGKFRVVTIDTAVRSIVLEALVNMNCGYHGLEPGIPGS